MTADLTDVSAVDDPPTPGEQAGDKPQRGMAVTWTETPAYKDTMPATERLAEVIGGLTGGEPRPGQVDMSAAFEKAIRANKPVFVQAGTGTGKSFGALVPAICSGKKVVVVTSSKALQDQLANKDLPFLQTHLGVKFRWAVLKGRSNYGCRAKAEEAQVEIKRRSAAADQTTLFEKTEFKAGDADTDDDFDDEELFDEVERLLGWLETTKTGDRAELPFEPTPKAWGKIAVGPSECPGKKTCSHGDECLAERAKEHAERADVLIVNAHLYGAHIATGSALLPPHDIVVVDEAHDFEDALVGALSSEMSGMRIRQVRRAAKRVVSGDAEFLSDLQTVANRIDDALARLYEHLSRDGGSTRLQPGPLAYDDLADALVRVATSAQNTVDNLKVIAAKNLTNASFVNRVERASRMASSLLADTKTALAADDESVCWVEEFSGRHVLKIGTIRMGGLLKTAIWDEGILGLFCSATLPRTTPGRLGVSDADYLDVGSPFDFKSNAVLYVPADDMPDPRNAAWPAAVARETTALIRAADGRTLALFTSNAMMRKTAEACRENLPDFTILCQGDMPKPALVEAFTADPRTCLFATASFWQGIDVPGSTLSCVVVDKIPFPVPTDPIVEARQAAVVEETGDDWAAFSKVAIPAAAVQLAQGVGRLIRTSTDKGLVAVLDKRLATAKYRQQILTVLPPMKRVKDPDIAYRFLRELVAEL